MKTIGRFLMKSMFVLKIIGIKYLTTQLDLKNSYYFIDSNRIRKN